MRQFDFCPIRLVHWFRGYVKPVEMSSSPIPLGWLKSKGFVCSVLAVEYSKELKVAAAQRVTYSRIILAFWRIVAYSYLRNEAQPGGSNDDNTLARTGSIRPR